jgi:hypothetical protein
MFTEALQARLKVLEDEIVRLTKLAPQSPAEAEQGNYWRLAQDLQREARERRSELRKISESPAADSEHGADTPVRAANPAF